MIKCPACNSKQTVAHSDPGHGGVAYLCLSCHQVFSALSRHRSGKVLLGIVGTIVFLSPMLLYLPMKAMLGLLSDTDNASVDTIVVLGRGPNSLTDRALVAAQYWQDNQSANIFVSGMMDAPVIIDDLQAMGVPATQISGERCSESTWENALFSDALLQPSVNDRILLITDEPHMVRSVWVFKGFGFKQVKPYVVEQNPLVSLSRQRAYRMIREYAALVKYGVLGRYSPATPEQHRQAEATAKFRVEDWNCYLPPTEGAD
jgi:uncharacterized SAM-binding protein YcdF (DUF218 family)